tara:strand:+ start:1684 stop:2211 length:528 start_codon:yes stop_codon:yes gene_type:complete
MDPVTIAAAITATRTLVKGAKGVKDIAHGLDQLFHAQAEHEKAKKKKGKPKTRTQQIVNMRAKEGDEAFDDETSMGTVVSDVLEKKQLDINLQNLKNEIDSKWGAGTWKAIEEERARRIKKKKELKKQRAEAAKERAEHAKVFWKKVAIESLKGAVVIGMITAFVFWIIHIESTR